MNLKHLRQRMNRRIDTLLSKASPEIAGFLTTPISPRYALMSTLMNAALVAGCGEIPNTDGPKFYDFTLPPLEIVSDQPSAGGRVNEEYPAYPITPSKADAACVITSPNSNGFYIDENNMLRGKPYHASNSTLGLTEITVKCEKEKFRPARQTFTIEVEPGVLPGSTIKYTHIQEGNVDADPEPEFISLCEENYCMPAFVNNDGSLEARTLGDAENQIKEKLIPIIQLDVSPDINPPVIIHYVNSGGDSACPVRPSTNPNAITIGGGNLVCVYELNDVTEAHEYFHSTTFWDFQTEMAERFAYPLETIMRNFGSNPQFSLCEVYGSGYQSMLGEMCRNYGIDVKDLPEFLQTTRMLHDRNANFKTPTSATQNKCTFDRIAGEIAGAPVNTYATFYATVCQGPDPMNCSTNPASLRYVDPNECSDKAR